MDGQTPHKEVVTIQKVEGSHKNSLWDVGFDALAPSKASFLILEKKARLSVEGEDLLRRNSLKLFSQAFSLTCLADDKAQDRQASEAQKSNEMLELRPGMGNLKTEINQLKDLCQKIEHLYIVKTQEALALTEEKNKLLAEIENLKKKMAHDPVGHR